MHFLNFISFQDSKQFEIFECLQFGRRAKKYSSIVRIFCLTIHFYSPKAYEYIRSFFNLNLPHIRTIRNWYSAIKGSPGFTESAFDALKQKANEAKKKGESLNVCLIHDDMSIRQHSQWSSAEEKFFGHINAGKPEEHNLFAPLAKQAYVLMVSGIGKEFKLPIGYFLIRSLCAQERAAILYEALFMLNKIGVTVCAITNDGHISNISAAKILGADYKADKPYFENPFDDKKVIYQILDPPHMIKLARNCLGNKETIFDSEDKEIKWVFFENLVTLQISENINFGNKLTKSHLEYTKRKMNVRLATETLSNSSASSIEYLDRVKKLEKFQNSESTVEYFRCCNNMLDIMNTKKNHCNEQYRRPISETTVDEFAAYFDNAKNYIKGLQLMVGNQKKSILKTKSFTPFFGFYHNMSSFMGIYHDYVKPNGINEFYTFDVSQDHLESFFGCIRRMGGSILIRLFY